ncbi:MAG: hypothetical protein MI757_01905 [Pirellulales bacterium]|nr:hypothetical protein [Pirellulales bacterium]
MASAKTANMTLVQTRLQTAEVLPLFLFRVDMPTIVLVAGHYRHTQRCDPSSPWQEFLETKTASRLVEDDEEAKKDAIFDDEVSNMSDARRQFVVPVLLLAFGVGWLLNGLGMLPGVDWGWSIGLAACGLITFFAGGLNRRPLAFGGFLVAASVLSVARQ